ncbi:MAG: hypothetical protein PHI63_03330 [Patescibacteria group bacterium]|nr:hypothetical protein [Patescibacteria group bacterium]
MPQSEQPVGIRDEVTRKLLVGMLAAQMMDDLGEFKRRIGPFVRPEDFPDLVKVKEIFWGLMEEAMALVRKSDMARVRSHPSKDGPPKSGNTAHG